MKSNNNLFNANDIALFEHANKGDESAFKSLYLRYKKYGEKLARKEFLNRGFTDNVVDEYLPEVDFVFLNTFRTFSAQRGAFRAYFTVVLLNSVKRYIGRVVLTNDLLRQCVSLDTTNNDSAIYETVADNKEIDPSEYTSINDLKLAISSPSKDRKNYSIKEAKQILILKQIGYTFTEIAKMLHTSRRRVTKLYSNLIHDLSLKMH